MLTGLRGKAWDAILLFGIHSATTWGSDKAATIKPSFSDSAVSAYSSLPLAIRTVKTRTLSLRDVNDGNTAVSAGLPGSPIHPVLLLKAAGIAFAVHKIPQTAAARVNRTIERCFYRLREPSVSR